MAPRKAKPNVDKTGRTANDQFTKLERRMLLHPSFMALSCTAKALYPHLKMHAYGGKNGKICMTVDHAATVLGVSRNTANKALHELQAKGFVVLTSLGKLGVAGKRSSPTYAVTEFPIPPEIVPRLHYQHWKPGNDFPVQRHGTNNPNGWNGKTHLKT